MDEQLNVITEYFTFIDRIKVKYTVNSNGYKHGLYIEQYENGNIKIKCYYNNGRKEGLYSHFYREVSFSYLTNEYVQFPREIGTYLNDKKHDKWEKYDDNIIITTFYDNGIKIGESHNQISNYLCLHKYCMDYPCFWYYTIH
jgi:antitoxin component YwqK of YwqJK toxin-antitoxin module